VSEPIGTRDGSVVRYLQLAHNEWDPAGKSSKMKVLYNFGRAEDLDQGAVKRLIAGRPGPEPGLR
jgi:hypothetical protein